MKSVLTPLIATLIVQSVVSFIVFAPPVFAPVAGPQIKLDASAVGLVTSFIYLAASFAALGSSGFIARYGPLRVSQVCMLFAAIGLSLMTLGTAFAILLGAVIVGLGYGPITPSSSAVLNERTPDRWRALIFSLKQTGVPIGGVVAGALLPVLMVMLGWITATLLCGLACVVIAIALQPLRADTDRSRNRLAPAFRLQLREPLRLVFKHRQLREMGWSSFAFSGMQMCVGSFLVVFLHDALRYSVAAAGATLSAAMLGGIVGRIGWGIVADHWVRPRILLGALGVAMSIGAFTLGTLTPAWPLAAAVVYGFLFGATAIGWNGVYLSEVARIAPKGSAALATGGTIAMTYLGVVLMPITIWVIVHFTNSYPIGFCALGLITLWRGVNFFTWGKERGGTTEKSKAA